MVQGSHSIIIFQFYIRASSQVLFDSFDISAHGGFVN